VQDFLYLNFLSQAPIFILGCFLFFSLKRSSDLYKNVPALCVCLIASFMLRKHFALGEKQFFFLLVIYGVGLLAYAVVRMRLSFGPLERLGRNSYAIYLVHSFVIFGLSTLAGKLAIDKSGLYMFLLAFFTSLAISYWLAVFLHIVVERRAHELSESLVAWRESGVWQLKAIRTKS
jgi:peptidoglycan/LPS O-acetylase OafA/YrhL